MTYTDALALRDALEAATLSSAGMVSVEYDGKKVTYQTAGAARNALAQLNRDIAAYNRRASGLNPRVSTVRWR